MHTILQIPAAGCVSYFNPPNRSFVDESFKFKDVRV